MSRRTLELAAARRRQREEESDARKARGRLTRLAPGEQLETRYVLGGAYRGADIDERSFLTHAVLVDSSGRDVRTLCSQPVDHMADSLSRSPDELLEAPSCPRCLPLWERLQGTMQRNGKLKLVDPEPDVANSSALSRVKLRAARGADFESAMIGAGNFAKKQGVTCYVYRGNSFGHSVFRFTNKKSDALSPINNTGHSVWEVTPDLQVTRYGAERDDPDDEMESNPDSKLEWVKGPSVDHDGHSLAWWKNKAARQKSQYDRMTVFIQVLCWDRAGASTRDWPQFDPGELKEAKAWAKEFVETTGGSCQVEGRVTIPYQGSVTIPLGEWKNNASNGWYVWSVDGKTFVPVSRSGPFQDQDEAVTVAKQQAKGGGTYDAVITFGGDPEASDFEIWKSFKAWSGEVHYTTDLPRVGGRLREYR